jgi:multidrug efflux pump subunit AcrB
VWIVRLALKRTYTFVVAALLIAVLGAVSVYRMSTDIFPTIDIPVISTVWQFTGMPADEIESRIILVTERVLTASVNGIEHIESQSLDGIGVIRIYFQPGAAIAEAEAQVTATVQTLLKLMPPGITPPYIVRYSVTSVPIVQIAVSSDTLTEAVSTRSLTKMIRVSISSAGMPANCQTTLTMGMSMFGKMSVDMR